MGFPLALREVRLSMTRNSPKVRPMISDGIHKTPVLAC